MVEKLKMQVGIIGGERVAEIGRKLNDLEAKLDELQTNLYQAKKSISDVRGALLDAIHIQQVNPTEESVQEETKSSREIVIQKAKDYLEEQKRKSGYYPMGYRSAEVKFYVNKEKRTVVAVLHGYQTGKVLGKGVAKAVKGDVYNEHIGKAIALAKALDKPIPADFINAPYPDECNVGDIVKSHSGHVYKLTARNESLDQYNNGRGFNLDNTIMWAGENQLTIIDDTKYESTGEL